jgi:hypothetical protein
MQAKQGGGFPGHEIVTVLRDGHRRLAQLEGTVSVQSEEIGTWGAFGMLGTKASVVVRGYKTGVIPLPNS